MRIFFKILLFPISLILTIIVAFSNFIIEKCAGILNIFAGLLFLGALTMYIQYFFGWPYGEAGTTDSLVTAIIATVMAFLLSPYGLPTLSLWLIDKLDTLNDAIKSI